MSNHSSKFGYQQADPIKGNIKVDSSCQHNKEQTNVNESAEANLKPKLRLPLVRTKAQPSSNTLPLLWTS